MRFLLALALIATFAAPLHAQEYKRNAWGMAFAPMTYGSTEGNAFETNNTSLDVGIFYARFFTPKFSTRLEVFAQNRHVISFGSYGTQVYSVDENGLTGAVLLAGDRRIDLSGHEARFSSGGGFTVTAITGQERFSTSYADPDAGTYGKVGFLVDAGMTLGLHSSTGVFTRFRYQQDWTTFADDGDRTMLYRTFGFLVGMEFGF